MIRHCSQTVHYGETVRGMPGLSDADPRRLRERLEELTHNQELIECMKFSAYMLSTSLRHAYILPSLCLDALVGSFGVCALRSTAGGGRPP